MCVWTQRLRYTSPSCTQSFLGFVPKGPYSPTEPRKNVCLTIFLSLICSEKHNFLSRQWKEQIRVLQHWHQDKMFSMQTSASSRAPQSAATGGGSSRGASSALSWRDDDGGDGVRGGGTSEVPDSLCFSWTAHKASRLPVNFWGCISVAEADDRSRSLVYRPPGFLFVFCFPPLLCFSLLLWRTINKLWVDRMSYLLFIITASIVVFWPEETPAWLWCGLDNFLFL